MDVARGEHGIATVVELGFVEAPGDAALAIGQLSGYSLFHSKSLAVIGVGKGCYSSNTGKRGRISSFYEITPLGRENLACFRTRCTSRCRSTWLECPRSGRYASRRTICWPST